MKEKKNDRKSINVRAARVPIETERVIAVTYKNDKYETRTFAVVITIAARFFWFTVVTRKDR